MTSIFYKLIQVIIIASGPDVRRNTPKILGWIHQELGGLFENSKVVKLWIAYLTDFSGPAYDNDLA